MTAAPVVEVVVPVYNEEVQLAESVERLHRYLTEHFPFAWRVTVADNASTDGTRGIAEQLAHRLPGVGLVALDRKHSRLKFLDRAIQVIERLSPHRVLSHHFPSAPRHLEIDIDSSTTPDPASNTRQLDA